MKTNRLIPFILVAALAGAGGWFAARHWPSTAPSSSDGRKILYYQSSMHPWIKSDKPGRCTICGMELTPVFEGEKGFDDGAGLVSLGSNAVQVINVQTETAQRRPLRRNLRVAGMIDDDDTRHRIVSAYVDGRVDKLGVNFVGAEVVVGQPLATFYSPMLLAAESEYRSLLKPSQPTQARADAAADHARLVAAAAQRLKRYGLTEAQIQALEKKGEDEIQTHLLAPLSGTVVARQVYEGQYVKEGDKLFEIADFSTMWFLFDAYERDLSWLQPGQKVDVHVPANPGRTFPGAIAFIDPNLKEMTRSAKVRVELANPLVEIEGRKRRELFHKLYADAVVHVATPEVLLVPRSAVLFPGPQAIVYVDQGGAYEPRKVKLGRAGDDDWEVLDGLSEGERVVTTGNLLIDAQAQFKAGAAGGHAHGADATSSDSPRSVEEPAVTMTNFASKALPPLTAEEQKAAKEFLTLADTITASLAADNLAEFNAQAAKTHAAAPALVAAFPKTSPWHSLLDRIKSASHVASAGDLKAARKNFHPFSEAAVSLAKALRQQEGGFKSVKVFRCPMTKDAFPGAPRTAEWIQFQAPIRNPYFGAEMLDCGSEVKP